MPTTSTSPRRTFRRVYALRHGARLLRDSENRPITSPELRDYCQSLYQILLESFRKLDAQSPKEKSQTASLKKVLDELLSAQRLLDR